jgi:hypothetical protein
MQDNRRVGVICEIVRVLENEPPIEHIEAGGGDVVQGGTLRRYGKPQERREHRDKENRQGRRQEACSPKRIEAQKRKTARFDIGDDPLRHQETRDDEKDVNADEAAGYAPGEIVIYDDNADRQSAKGLNRSNHSQISTCNLRGALLAPLPPDARLST